MVVDYEAAAWNLVTTLCGWQIAPVRDEVFTLDGSGMREQFIPAMKINQLHLVTSKKCSVITDLTTLVEVSKAGILRLPAHRVFTDEFSGVTVNANVGYHYADIPDVVALVEELKTRLQSYTIAQGRIKSQSVNGASVSYDTSSVLMSSEDQILQRYKICKEV